MPGLKYDQLLQNNNFGPKLARDNALRLRKYLKKAAESLANKPADDPEALRNLKEYIVSRTVEEEVLKQTMEDKEYAGARNERMTEVVNSGSGVMKMETDELFREVMQKQAGKTIDSETIYEEYQSLSIARNMELNHPLVRLKKERERLIESFGSKPVTKDCLADVFRLNMLDGSIKAAEKLPKDTNLISKDDSINFNHALTDIHRNEEVSGRMSPERREAIARSARRRKMPERPSPWNRWPRWSTTRWSATRPGSGTSPRRSCEKTESPPKRQRVPLWRAFDVGGSASDYRIGEDRQRGACLGLRKGSPAAGLSVNVTVYSKFAG